jgi:hypothetical protein
VLALWSFEPIYNDKEEKEKLLEIAHMAVQCSLYLQEQLGQFRVEIGTNTNQCVVLKTHTGLGLGEVKVFLLSLISP